MPGSSPHATAKGSIFLHMFLNPLVGAHVVPRCAKSSADMPTVGMFAIGMNDAVTAAIHAMKFIFFLKETRTMMFASRWKMLACEKI